MNDEFISDKEVEAYERRADPARRAVVWSLAAVAAAFVFIGGAYAFGHFGADGNLTASLLGGASEEGEVFPLWSAGRDENASFAKSSNESSVVSSAGCGFESGPSQDPSAVSLGTNRSGQAISVLFAEIAWMGTEEGAQYEWIELANMSGTNAEIGGWSVVDKDEQIQFVFPKNTSIPVGGFVLLARGADRVGSVKADYRYTGNLKNEDEGLRLFNSNCEVMDEVLTAPKWPAGESVERRTMERNFATRAWYTSSVEGGTPKAANSKGWSNILDHPPVVSVETSSAVTSTPTFQSGLATSSPTSVGIAAVVISEVMAGKDGAANWDFVELHNPGSGAVNLTGWSVKKRSSTGSESALVAAARLEGKIIPVGGYFLLAHPDYVGAPSADVVWPKSYTLAYTNNAVVIYNADGEKASEVSWTEIPKGQSYAEVNGTWVIANPTPKAAP